MSDLYFSLGIFKLHRTISAVRYRESVTFSDRTVGQTHSLPSGLYPRKVSRRYASHRHTRWKRINDGTLSRIGNMAVIVTARANSPISSARTKCRHNRIVKRELDSIATSRAIAFDPISEPFASTVSDMQIRTCIVIGLHTLKVSRRPGRTRCSQSDYTRASSTSGDSSIRNLVGCARGLIGTN